MELLAGRLLDVHHVARRVVLIRDSGALFIVQSHVVDGVDRRIQGTGQVVVPAAVKHFERGVLGDAVAEIGSSLAVAAFRLFPRSDVARVEISHRGVDLEVALKVVVDGAGEGRRGRFVAGVARGPLTHHRLFFAGQPAIVSANRHSFVSEQFSEERALGDSEV